MPHHKKESLLQKKRNDSVKVNVRTYSMDGLDMVYYLANEENDNKLSLLHMNSLNGQPEFTKWLIESLNLDPCLTDVSSNWTPLHTAAYYGQLRVANELIKNCCPLEALDNSGYSALDLLNVDLPPHISYSFTDSSDVYVWGDNRNFSLGHSSCADRKYPELLEFFSTKETSIKKVVMSRFHSLFLTNTGLIFSCGIGTGGRLGLGHQETIIQPCRVKVPGKYMDIACGPDHSIMLSESGQIYVCGSNKHHQLGLQDDKENVLKPKLLRILIKDETICGVLAAAFHALFFTKTSVYTWGLNAGQLGHVCVSKQIYQVAPRVVSAVHDLKSDITMVASSDGAILIATADCQVFLLNDYTCKKINFKQGGKITQIAVTGGKLDPSRVSNALEYNKEVFAVFLNSNNCLFLWRESLPGIRRLFVFNPQRLLYPTRFAIWSKGLIFVSDKGTAYTAKIPQDLHLQKGDPLSQTTLALMLKDDSYRLNCSQIPRIFRGVDIVSDPDGKRFAFRQSIPRMNLTYIPEASQSIMASQMLRLLEEGPFYDLKLKSCDNQLFSCHKCVLSMTSPLFCRLLNDEQFHPPSFISFSNEMTDTPANNLHPAEIDDSLIICLQDCDASTVKNALKILYSGIENTNIKVGSNVKRLLSRLGIKNGPCSLDRINGGFHDAVLRSCDDISFPCHKAVLSARSDFFRTMFACSWSESSAPEIVVGEDGLVLTTVLQYIYEDKITLDCHSVDETQLTNWGRILAASEFYQIERLKELLQVHLAASLTLRDVLGILELARYYHADQLKLACLDFIHINAAALLETRSFDGLPEDTFADVESHYQQQLPWFHLRRTKPDNDIYEYVYQYFLDNGDLEHSTYTRERTSSTGNAISLQHTAGKSRKKNSKSRRLSAGSSSDESVSERLNSLTASASDGEATNINSEKLGNHVKDLGVTESEFPDIDTKFVDEESVNCVVEITNRGDDIIKKPRAKSFREIMEEETMKLETTSVKSIPKSSKKFSSGKLSQRELKLKLAQQEPQTTKLPTIAPLKLAPWAQSLKSPVQSNLRDIISQESVELNSSSNINLPSSTNNNSSRLNKTAAASASPWKEAVHKSNGCCSLSAIQRDEENRVAAETRVQKKSFELIQIEERAMQELRAIYNADECTDEFIVVECVLPVAIPSPSWNIH